MDQDDAEVYRVVRVITYESGARCRSYFGPYRNLVSAKGARAVLARHKPIELFDEVSYEYEIERATTKWETVT
ncbi:hypothetical protein AB0B15_03430 [Streptomyces sp. NPDC045456]|uniref:hypothetical protein n=1 Tax=Streptomyces sp. NPDC045456 TaxID=3155254 RepID=UPI0033EE9034